MTVGLAILITLKNVFLKFQKEIFFKKINEQFNYRITNKIEKYLLKNKK